MASMLKFFFVFQGTIIHIDLKYEFLFGWGTKLLSTTNKNIKYLQLHINL